MLQYTNSYLNVSECILLFYILIYIYVYQTIIVILITINLQRNPNYIFLKFFSNRYEYFNL